MKNMMDSFKQKVISDSKRIISDSMFQHQFSFLTILLFFLFCIFLEFLLNFRKGDFLEFLKNLLVFCFILLSRVLTHDLSFRPKQKFFEQKLTTSPSSTTFSPRIKKTPRDFSPYSFSKKILSFVSSSTILAKRICSVFFCKIKEKKISKTKLIERAKNSN